MVAHGKRQELLQVLYIKVAHLLFGTRYLSVTDTFKEGSQLKIIDGLNSSQNVYLKRNLKRSNSHWQPDSRQDRPEWTMIGDDKRFYFVIGYKQNPKDHTHIIVFGDIEDWNDQTLKSILIGYVDLSIGNVGSNSIFAYPEWSILETGHLLCQSKGTARSDSRWVRSDADGNLIYLKGSADCGQRMYPIPFSDI